MGTPRFKVYLAGPIGGCNEAQRRRWREHVRERWGKDFDFIDPTEHLVTAERLSHEIIERDLRSIEEADGVLANMWKESVGTAIGVAIASAHGRAVVVVDPNHVQSRILSFYASAVVERLDEGIRALRDLLRSERSLRVIGRDGKEEQFQRAKLLAALRGACRGARRNDVVVPPLVLQHVLRRIEGEPRGLGGRVTTTRIDAIVLDVLRALEADPAHAKSLEGVAEAWARFLGDREKAGPRARPAPAAAPGPTTVPPRPLSVAVRSAKSHASIWGKTVKGLPDVPSGPRAILKLVTTVPGIAEVRITRMSRGPAGDSLGAEILPSTTPHVIEGKLHDPEGKKGTVQAFQVRVHDEARRDEIADELVRLLERHGFARGP